jgi:glycosyltransferase involved in cell wall biosynthesis
MVDANTAGLPTTGPSISTANLAILFEPDGYVLEGPKLMGRQSAGNGFLRAAVAGLKDETLFAYTPRQQSADVFRQMVSAINPAARTGWIPANRLDHLARVGTLYVPDPSLTERARLRLRVGPAAYSLIGVTHTTASQRAMDEIASLPSGPVMPWDALICTSSAVATTVRMLLAAEADYLKWRVGAQRFTLPQLPVIPLGVHCDDWATNPQERSRARQELGIAPDQVVALFVGRLSSHAKAHPYPMYAGLEATAQRTGRAITLIQCGWFSSVVAEHAFKQGARQFCPSCTVIWANGKSAEERRRAWASADLFISLSDNIQETLGLTPIEAMAAGLPVIVTDWDGYKDTVRDGQDGFRIPTWMAPAGLGESLGQAYEAGTHSYDQHCGAASQLTSIDMRALVDRLSDLAEEPHLRRQLGEAGRRRARAVYDWSVIFRQYKALWRELAERRKHHSGLTARAPKVAPGHMNPLRAFGHYATRHLSSETRIELSGSRDAWTDLFQHPLFSRTLRRRDLIEAVLEILRSGEPISLVKLSQQLGAPPAAVAAAACLLAKMNLVRLIP